MRRIFGLVLVAALLAGCNPAPATTGVTNDGRVQVWHDDIRNVTCWIYLSYGIHCIPDDEY